jgi:RNA polymerase sigma factor (TIGR02999 family)
MSGVTQILASIEQGDSHAAEKLLPLVYDELRKLAAARMAAEVPGQTLQATALVHEAYIRLVENDKVKHWDSRGHFFAAAAEAMRRILVERARRQATEKHGGRLRRQDVHELEPPAESHSRKADLVKLRYFAGLTHAEAAACLGISTATADRDWAYAKAWLHRAMSRGSSGR